MRVLAYSNRKSDPELWDASTPIKEERAFRELFQLLDDDWGVYADLAEDSPSSKGQKLQREWYEAALKGDYKALRKLMDLRRAYEYEEWSLIDIKLPKGAN